MITIATDGSCIGNPGPGAYAIYGEFPGGNIARAIPAPATKIGEMEVRGLLEALLFLGEFLATSEMPALIQCDSKYVVNGYNDWMAGWKAKGWKKKGGLAHAALWQQIDEAKAALPSAVTVEWVRAHQNTGSLNDKVDSIANSCARSQAPMNGPALQASEPSNHIVIDNPAATAATEAKPSYDDLLDLLNEAWAVINASQGSEDASLLKRMETVLSAR